MAKQIPLTKGKFATVDDSDYEWLNQWKWQAHKRRDTWYAERRQSVTPGRKGIRVNLKMHRVILGVTDPKIQVDHRDGDGLNCQRHNLRKATQPENRRNAKIQKNNTSGFKGVNLIRVIGKFQARIMVNKVIITIGYFKTAEEAGRANDEAAKKHHGEFARLNFHDE